MLLLFQKFEDLTLKQRNCLLKQEILIHDSDLSGSFLLQTAETLLTLGVLVLCWLVWSPQGGGAVRPDPPPSLLYSCYGRSSECVWYLDEYFLPLLHTLLCS